MCNGRSNINHIIRYSYDKNDDVVVPIDPEFYKRYVDDTITKRKRNAVDTFFQKLNSYHPKIKLTIELNPSKFLGTDIINTGGIFTTQVFRKPTKFPIHWSSCIPKRYKRNTVNGELHRAKRIASDLQVEIKAIQKKFQFAGYPPRFVNSVIKYFVIKSQQQDESILIPSNFFDEPKPKIFMELPFYTLNKTSAKLFIKKFHIFTNDKYILHIVWKTRNIRSLFLLKDKNIHPSSVIYLGTCSCNETYIGETVRNATTRFAEHNNALYE